MPQSSPESNARFPIAARGIVDPQLAQIAPSSGLRAVETSRRTPQKEQAMTIRQFLTITDHYSIEDVRRALVKGLQGGRPRTPDDFEELYSAAFARLRLVAQRIRWRGVRHHHPLSWIERGEQ